MWADPGREFVSLDRYDAECCGLIFTSGSRAEAQAWLDEMLSLCTGVCAG